MKSSDAQPEFRALSEAVDFGVGWTLRSETSGRDYVSLSLAAPEFDCAGSMRNRPCGRWR